MLLKSFVCPILLLCLARGLAAAAAFLAVPSLSTGADQTEVVSAHKKKSKKSHTPPEPVHVDCRCPPGYSHVNQSCVKKDYAGSPKAVCSEGQLDKGQCITKESEVLECPTGSESECDTFASAKKRCCRHTESALPRVVCPDDTEETKHGTCKRLSRSKPHYQCPPGYVHHDAGFCVRIEEGSVVPVCGHGGELTEDNECLATAPGSVVHECPEGYECVSNKEKSVLSKSFCTTCVKEKLEPLKCKCPPGTESIKGMCYSPGDAERCFKKRSKKKKASGKATDEGDGEEAQEEEYVELEEVKGGDLADVEADWKKFGKKCGAASPACTCGREYAMKCSDTRCQCVTEERVPVEQRCLHVEDAEGNCVKEVRLPPVYQCGEGQECEVIGKKSECRCVKKFTMEHTIDCEDGVLVGAECFSIEYIEKATFCPPEFELVCEDGECECQRESFVARVKTCPAGSYVTSKGCIRSGPPEFVCTKVRTQYCDSLFSRSLTVAWLQGILEKGQCYHKNYAVQVCDA